VNQEATALLMATLGVAYFLEGLGQLAFGASVYTINVGMPKEPAFILASYFEGGVLINLEDLTAALIAALLVASLALFFQVTATGRALRAVADDHQAAQSVGIPLNHIWVIVWTVAGVVALVAGLIWGSKFGVQFTLATATLRALPVVILGGLTSVPGAIIGGLIIGVGEKVSEVYLGPLVGGGIEIWFAYILALVFLLFRPQGYGTGCIFSKPNRWRGWGRMATRSAADSCRRYRCRAACGPAAGLSFCNHCESANRSAAIRPFSASK